MGAVPQTYTTKQVATALGWTPDDVRQSAENGELPCDIDETGRRRRFLFHSDPWDEILSSLRAGLSWDQISAQHLSTGGWGFGARRAAQDASTDGDTLALQLAMANGRIANLEHDLAEAHGQRAVLQARSDELIEQVTRLRKAVKALVE